MFSLLGKAAMCIVALISATATGYVYYHGGMDGRLPGITTRLDAWRRS